MYHSASWSRQAPTDRSLLERAFADALSGPERDDPNAAILDAAYELFCRQGIQRTTMDDVARRARLSRITVYRRMVSKEALVEAVLLRDFRQYVDRFLADSPVPRRWPTGSSSASSARCGPPGATR